MVGYFMASGQLLSVKKEEIAEAFVGGEVVREHSFVLADMMLRYPEFSELCCITVRGPRIIMHTSLEV